MNSEVTQKNSPCSKSQRLSFQVSTVTGTRSLTADVEASAPAETVAKALSAQLSLPENVPWTLRKDESTEYLDEGKEIGSQVEPGEHLTITPKAHLG